MLLVTNQEISTSSIQNKHLVCCFLVHSTTECFFLLLFGSICFLGSSASYPDCWDGDAGDGDEWFAQLGSCLQLSSSSESSESLSPNFFFL